MTNKIAQPPALYLLFFVQMWESFSYYGMRVLLVLYMSQVLEFSDTKTFGIFAVYCALKEFGGIFGGYLADRFLGQRFSIFTGGWVIALGHLMMMLGDGEVILYLSLSCIATGTGLFSTNISSLLSMFYGEKDPRREEGYTLFYIGINCGAILASICCGAIGEWFGWHAGFGAAAFGMVLANLALMSFSRVLEDKGNHLFPLSWQTIVKVFLGTGAVIIILASTIYMQQWTMHFLPLICIGLVCYAAKLIYASGLVTKQKIASLVGTLAVLAIFYAAEEQTGGALLLFAERFGDHVFLGIPIPSSVLIGINPFIIITCGVAISKLLHRFAISTCVRLAGGCALAASSFAMLSYLAHFEHVQVGYIMACILVLSLGELLIGPTVYAYFSEIAPERFQGMTMGLIPIGFALSNVIAGFFNLTMAMEISEESSSEIYVSGFASMSYLLAFVALAIYLTHYLINQKTAVAYGQEFNSEPFVQEVDIP